MKKFNLIFKFQYFNFARKRIFPINRNVLANNFEEVVDKYSQFYRHKAKSSENILSVEWAQFLDKLPQKQSIFDRINEFKKKYPTQESMIKQIIVDKRKTNPNFSEKDIKDEDMLKYFDPEIIKLSTSFTMTVEEKYKNEQTSPFNIKDEKTNVNNSDSSKSISPEINPMKASVKQNTNAPLKENILDITDQQFKLSEKFVKIDEKETDINKIKHKIFEDEQTQSPPHLKNKSNKEGKKNKSEIKSENKEKKTTPTPSKRKK